MTDQDRRRVQTVFLRALELNPPERAEYLDQECGDDSALRAEVGEMLVGQERRTGPGIEDRVDELRGDADAPDEQVPLALADALAGRYAIEKKIGAGGMATVYLAQDLKHRRKVAVKVLRPHVASSLGPDRFLREIEIAAGLTHPHVLPLHDSGDAAGFLYYVMPFIEGESLRDRLSRNGPLPVADAVKFFREIVEALGEAHKRSIVHRDVKPENVLLSGGHALVADFGVAKAVGEASEHSKLTTLGVSLGTPQYMAPEQAAADPATDHRADLFAASAVAYEMLTGRSPFEAASTRAVFGALMTREPQPPHTMRNEVPKPFSQVVMRGLEKAPDDRPQSSAELLGQLDAIASPTGSITPRRRSLNRQRSRLIKAWVPPALAVLVAAGLGARALGWLPGDGIGSQAGAPSYEKIAVMPFANQMNDPEQDYFVDGMTDALITELAKINSLGVVSRTSVMRFKNSGRSIPEIASELGADAIIEGSVLRAGGEVRVAANLVDATRDETLWANSYTGTLRDILRLQASVVLDIAEQINVALSPAQESQLASVGPVDPAAYDTYVRGRHFWNLRTSVSVERAIDHLNEAIRIVPDYALAHAGLADAYGMQGIYEYADPGVVYPRAREAALKAIDLDPLAGEPHTSLGLVRRNADHDWSGADASYRRGIELSPNNSQGHLYYASFLLNAGDLDGAEIAIERARNLDPVAPLVGAFQTQLKHYRRDAEGAIQVALAALEIDPDFPGTLRRLGESYLAANKNDLAVATFERLCEFSQRHPHFLAFLGLAYGRAGRIQDAQDIAAEITAKTENPHLLAGRLARIHLGLGEHEEAITSLKLSLGTGQMMHVDLSGEPAWDPLRSYSGFQEILDQIGFPEPVAR